ncbi:MAG: ribose-phosphate diphosphokinase [Mollicutes bacterium]|nr:ribose-phosphate diphosphokinase [Mollicutes bacterium]
MKNNLGLIVMDSIKEVGLKVEKELNRFLKTNENYIIPTKIIRFANGEGKAEILQTVRDKEIYILTDINNYSITYNMFGFENHYSPDNHYQDVKRIILAMCGHAKKITVVMPFLYQSRQHRRKSRESLDCAHALQELKRMNVDTIITFDVHDPDIINAIPLGKLENFYANNNILEAIVEEHDITSSNTIIISPDFGAMERARYFAEMLQVEVGVFYKRRDLSKIVNGKNPVIEHAYMGADVKNKNAIVVDDMIASGGSSVEVAENLKERGANKIFIASTFCLFTEGIDFIKKAYKEKIFDKVYTTNLSYLPKEIKKERLIKVVDCSKDLAEVIYYGYMNKSMAPLLDNKTRFFEELEKIRTRKKGK